MDGRGRLATILAAGVWLLGPWLTVSAETRPNAIAAPPDPGELSRLYQRRDYFTLRERLADLPGDESPGAEVRFYEAAVRQAFNDPQASSRILASLPIGELPPALASEARYLELLAHLRLHRYEPALVDARAFLADGGSRDPSRTAEVRGLVPLLWALADAPPQSVEITGPSRLVLGNDRRVAVRIAGRKLRLGLDTGANYSVLRLSEARKLGLAIRPAGLKVATATAREVLADVTVADRVEIGKVLYRNVVFLVFPDEALDLPRGRPLAGLVGFPLIEAMGEVRFRRDGILEVPATPPRRTSGNLALDHLDPLVPVRWERETLICRLDTGAAQTVFYEPFHRRHRERLEAYGRRVEVPVGGLGGVRELPALRLPTLLLTVAGGGLTLRDVDVYTVPVRPPERNYLDCNIGLDVLRRFRAYVVSFGDMALVLE